LPSALAEAYSTSNATPTPIANPNPVIAQCLEVDEDVKGEMVSILPELCVVDARDAAADMLVR
jgi:G3E family GTPase